mmetsp:Transcript_26870/g.87935  ORF Transcript_26870/g.87935 Transcript_26870/m.87935 type:complete len:274 (-) Transcript_26870:85-906(-)
MLYRCLKSFGIVVGDSVIDGSLCCCYLWRLFAVSIKVWNGRGCCRVFFSVKWIHDCFTQPLLCKTRSDPGRKFKSIEFLRTCFTRHQPFRHNLVLIANRLHRQVGPIVSSSFVDFTIVSCTIAAVLFDLHLRISILVHQRVLQTIESSLRHFSRWKHVSIVLVVQVQAEGTWSHPGHFICLLKTSPFFWPVGGIRILYIAFGLFLALNRPFPLENALLPQLLCFRCLNDAHSRTIESTATAQTCAVQPMISIIPTFSTIHVRKSESTQQEQTK